MRSYPQALALAITLAIAAGGTAAAESPDAGSALQPRASNSAYKVLKFLDYSGPKHATLRVGAYNSAGKGWGWNKVKKKHHITRYSALEYVTKAPNRAHQGGTSYRQHAYAGKYRCTNGKCHLVKQYKVYVIVNEKTLGDHHNRGVITGYCEGVVRCPSWVSVALSREDHRIAAGASQLGAAYAPLDVRLHRTRQGSP